VEINNLRRIALAQTASAPRSPPHPTPCPGTPDNQLTTRHSPLVTSHVTPSSRSPLGPERNQPAILDLSRGIGNARRHDGVDLFIRLSTRSPSGDARSCLPPTRPPGSNLRAICTRCPGKSEFARFALVWKTPKLGLFNFHNMFTMRMLQKRPPRILVCEVCFRNPLRRDFFQISRQKGYAVVELRVESRPDS
jgi:hypothetical protein